MDLVTLRLAPRSSTSETVETVRFEREVNDPGLWCGSKVADLRLRCLRRNVLGEIEQYAIRQVVWQVDMTAVHLRLNRLRCSGL